MSDTPTPRSKWRDFWQLHVPLVLVLIVCAVATVIEVKRAGEGVWRAWAYMIEWPLIGVLSVWIWHRYRTEGNVTGGFIEKWKQRVAEYAQADSVDDTTADAPASPASPSTANDDPQLQAWNAYVEDLQRRQPPGGPPSS